MKKKKNFLARKKNLMRRVTIASQITSLTIVYSIVYSDADQRKHQSSSSLAFVWGIHWGLVNSPHKWPVTRKMFPFDDAIIWKLQARNLHCQCRRCCMILTFNTLRPRQNGWHFLDNIFKCILMKISLKFAARVQLKIVHHWFRWLGTSQVTSHYLNQWWLILMTHICVTLPQWVKQLGNFFKM